MFNQYRQEYDNKLIFVFPPTIVHLKVEYIRNVVHTAQCSQKNIDSEVGVMPPLLHVYKGKDLPAVIDDSYTKKMM